MLDMVLIIFYKEYSLIGKIGSFRLQIPSSSLDALVKDYNEKTYKFTFILY